VHLAQIQLSDNKQTIRFGSRASLTKLQQDDCPLQVGTEVIESKSVVRHLSAHLDSELTMNQQIAKTAATCFYQIRRQAGQEVAQQLVLALATFNLDYCNDVLAGLPQFSLEPLQRVQNAPAGLVFGLNRFDHITVTSSLVQLHWLPVCYRMTFKL